jgi:putative drug exporter of the RND superfamily
VSSFLYRLGRASARARVLVVALWVVFLAVVGGATSLFNQGTDDTFAIPGSESQDALDYLGRVFPEASGSSAQLSTCRRSWAARCFRSDSSSSGCR